MEWWWYRNACFCYKLIAYQQIDDWWRLIPKNIQAFVLVDTTVYIVPTSPARELLGNEPGVAIHMVIRTPAFFILYSIYHNPKTAQGALDRLVRKPNIDLNLDL